MSSTDNYSEYIDSLSETTSAGCCNFRGSSDYQSYSSDSYNSKHYRKWVKTCDMPIHHADIMWESLLSYECEGLVRNVIDLMSDFGSCGIRLDHPVPSIQEFCRNWFLRVEGPDRSERYLNSLYQYGTAIVRRKVGSINQTEKKDLFKYKAGANIDRLKVKKSNIPINILFLIL